MLSSFFLLTLVFAYGENLGDDNTDVVQMAVHQREANDPCASQCPNACTGPQDACKPECQDCAACHGMTCNTAASGKLFTVTQTQARDHDHDFDNNHEAATSDADSFTTTDGLTFTGYGPGSSQTQGGQNWASAKAFCEGKGARLATAEEAIKYGTEFNNAKQGHCCYWLDEDVSGPGGISDAAFSTKMDTWRAYATSVGTTLTPDTRQNVYAVEDPPDTTMCLSAEDRNVHFRFRKCGHSRNTICVTGGQASADWIDLAGKTVTTAESEPGYGGDLAIDGNTDTNMAATKGFHSKCGREPSFPTGVTDEAQKGQWWMIDLGASYSITEVKIYNRADCCQDRIKGLKIYVDDTECEGNLQDSSPEVTVSCVATGQTVKLIRPGASYACNVLQLPEVQIKGSAAAASAAAAGSPRRRTGVRNQLCNDRSSPGYPADTQQHSKAACENFLTPAFQAGGVCEGGRGFYGYNGRNECYCCTNVETVDVNPFTRGGYTTYQIASFDQAPSTSLRRKQDAIQISSIKASSASCDGCSSGGCDPRGPDRLISGCDSTVCTTLWGCGGSCDAGVLTVNGNGQGEWCSKGGSAASAGGQWLDIDLGSEYSVSKIELWSGASGNRFPQELQILTGGSIDDGSTGSGTGATACFDKSGIAADSGGWTAAGGPYTIGAGTTLTGCANARNKAGVNTQVDSDKCEVDVTGVTGQYIRLWFKGTAGNDNYMELRKVQVFGSAAAASGNREANCLAYPYQNGFYRNRFYEGCGYVGSLGGWQQCQDKCNECGESACRAACRNGCDYMKCESDTWKNRGCAMTNPQCVDNGGWATPDCTEGATIDFTDHSAVKEAFLGGKLVAHSKITSADATCTEGTPFWCQNGNPSASTDGYDYCADNTLCPANVLQHNWAASNQPGDRVDGNCCYCGACLSYQA